MVLRQSPVPLNMLFQQMKSMRSFKIEETTGTLPTPSIAVANTDKTPNESTAGYRSRLKESLHGPSPTYDDSNCYLLSVPVSQTPSTAYPSLKDKL